MNPQLIINDLSLNLKNLNVSTIDFLFNYKQYLIDEEYILDKHFVKCFHCDSINIDFQIFNEIEEKYFYEFCDNFRDFDYYRLLIDNFEECVKKHKALRILYCKDCNTILNINNKDQVINLDLESSNIIPLLSESNFILKKDNITFPKICPFCKNTTFNVDTFNEDYTCSNCKNYIISNDGKIHYYPYLKEYLNQKENPIIYNGLII